jgi:hypothetical protein
MSKHTPGPWIVSSQHNDWHDKMDGVIVRSCNDAEIWPAGAQKLGDEMADMQLIAAAPDMLEALLALNELQHGKHPLQINVMAAWALLDAAIAKATGAAA